MSAGAAAASSPTTSDAAGTAEGGEGLFDLPPNTGPTRERVVVDRDDYDPDSLDDVVQTSTE